MTASAAPISKIPPDFLGVVQRLFVQRFPRASQKYNICYRMSASLVQKLSTDRITFDQLVTLLGKPDAHVTPAEWRYKLKANPITIFPDDYWLSVTVRFEDKRIIKATVHPG